MENEGSKVEWPKAAILRLIELWEGYESLYNPHHKLYHNKHARQQAFSDLAEKLSDLLPTIGSTEVKAKLTYLRGQYTREVAKQKERKSGAGAEEVYIPSAFYFEKLTFLQAFIKVRKGESNFISVSFSAFSQLPVR
ncbi:PREDICTED: uncharacterized protein LOC108360174 [Rhagoletis zephyria]|uniref:uncharacterized protein LOC108360174 n=1 Tax=Rhagoletis zephyria TaxID=28612 RepID=UPI0008118B43|nr:PREDICTED: uncharacterized protein LOC108360174 [Rhagoletis zephyria]